MNNKPCESRTYPGSRAKCEVVGPHTVHLHTFYDATGRVECVSEWTDPR